ncbi:UNVERIFIED_CONTAM: hypothetical protein Sradi_0194300 [Sesamum radiatum]|uniref:Uncharacterized protein n=1 Tax=Sesamum radiatum TaxID=300843 RepID=A0AAW2W0W9_SESRA
MEADYIGVWVWVLELACGGRYRFQDQCFSDLSPLCPHVSTICWFALIERKLGVWIRERLLEFFLPFDVEAIQAIPLGRTDRLDWAIWHYTSDGRFSVHSVYHLACMLVVGTPLWSFI